MAFQRSWLLPIALAASSCSSGPAADDPSKDDKPAEFAILRDLSSSSALGENREFARKAGERVSREIVALRPILGDFVSFREIAERDTVRALSKTLPFDRQHRVPAVANLAGRIIAATPESPDRDQKATNILFTLSNTGIQCSQRGMIWVLSDGIQSQVDGFPGPSGLLNGTTELPAPKTMYLRGCRVTWLGIGLTSASSPQLSELQIANLKAAWTRYLISSGIEPRALTLISGF